MLLKLSEAALALNGEFRGDGEKIITGMFTDTRESFTGGLFFAQIGERVDGHTFVPALNAQGFPCVVSEKEYFTGDNILVKNTELALGDLARRWREKYVPETKVAAVTGSVGKTTTKDMLGLALSSTFNTFVPKGNRNSVIGLPMSVSMLVPSHEYAVFELGSSKPGEISYLSEIVRPHISVITCIGSSHLEFFGTRDNIRKEKYGVVSGEPEGGYLILDGDSDEEYAMRRCYRQYKLIYCGSAARCDFRIVDVVTRGGSTVYSLVWEDGSLIVRLNAEGAHIVKDSSYALAAAILCGADPEKAANALAGYAPYGDRQRIYEKNGVTVIADCYNASPESMRAAFGVLGARKGRKIAVLGDMLELGADSPRIHAKNAALASQTADILIFVGEYASVCASACGEKKTYCFETNDKHSAASALKEILERGDTVLFKGSRGIALDEIIKEADL